MDIYPVLNCRDAEEVHGMLKAVQGFLPFGQHIHLDVADGKFTPHKTWNAPEDWPSFRANYNLEVHLMTEEPEKEVPRWLAVGASRVIVHLEALTQDEHHVARRGVDELITEILAACFPASAEALLAVSPETPVATALQHFKRMNGAQVLAVNPGLSGQKFQSTILQKVAYLRQAMPGATIEVDGGITPAIVRRVREAGATVAVSSHYIFESGDPKRAYQELVAAAKGLAPGERE
jgi:ribulose-phosphate 3-epimerase